VKRINGRMHEDMYELRSAAAILGLRQEGRKRISHLLRGRLLEEGLWVYGSTTKPNAKKEGKKGGERENVAEVT